MKKIISSILIAIVVLQLFAPFSVELSGKKLAINKAEAADCVINSVSFTPAGGAERNSAVSLPPYITATINTTNCINKFFEFKVMEFTDINESPISMNFTVLENQTKLKLSPTDLYCEDGICDFGWNITSQDITGKHVVDANQESDIYYRCLTAGCTNQSNWDGEILSGAKNDTSAISTEGLVYKIDLNGAVTHTDKKATINIAIANRTEETKAVIIVRTYNYYLRLHLRDQSGAIIDEKFLSIGANLNTKIDPITFNINPGSTYTITGYLDMTEYMAAGGTSSTTEYPKIARLSPLPAFTANPDGVTTVKDVGNFSAGSESIEKPSSLPVCGLQIKSESGGGTILGCVAQGLYYVFFVPTSAIFALTGKALDISLMFSISDASYRSSFVTEGWGIVRDFCNMFFIFVMLYIAIGTILNLSGVKTKEMIVNVVIIGLLINFSLLATQIIIDTSNILTRVFYNQSTIATGVATKDANGNILSVENNLGEFGEIKLSEAIVSKVDPQKLILEAQKVSALPIRGKANNEEIITTGQGISTGSFILVIILATAVNVFGIMAFFSCTIIFVARVVGLWIAMILAPLAFFSYTVPGLQSMDTIGFKHWWPETLRLAFLAPIFTFFMYIIVAFMGKGLDLINADGRTGLGFVVAIVLPFVFIMTLLTKAKDMAKDMSGKIGQAMSKAGDSVGKFAFGAGKLAAGAVGGAALGLGAGALRGTVGKMGNSLLNSEKLKAAQAKGGIAGFGAKTLRNIGGAAGSGSMDIRGTKLGAAAISKTGLNMGKAKEGGYVKSMEEKGKKRQEIAKSLEVGKNSPEVHDLHNKEEALQELKNKNSAEIEALDGKIAAKQTESMNKSRKAGDLEALAKNGTPEQKAEATKARQDAVNASKELSELTENKTNIKKNAKIGVNVTEKTAKKYEDSAKEAEDDVTEAETGVATATTTAETEVKTAETTAETEVATAAATAEAEIAAATTAAQNAEQERKDSFAKSTIDPSEENIAAYDKAKTKEAAAKANVDTVKEKSGSAVEAVRAKSEAAVQAVKAKSEAAVQAARDNLNSKQEKAITSREKATEARTHQSNGTKMQRSMAELEFEDIPEAKHTISTTNSNRRNLYADQLDNKIFNTRMNSEAAHDIRMGSEIKSEVKK